MGAPKSSTGKPEQSANVTFARQTPAPAAPGRDYLVQVKVTAPNGIKWIRMRYRHVNQKGDYQTART